MKVMVVSEGGPSFDARLGISLEALRREGRIDGYTLFDCQGRPSGPDLFAEYDALVVHRSLTPRCVQILAQRKIRYLLDLDDAPILALPGAPEAAALLSPLRETLFHAAAVLTSNPAQAEVASWHASLPLPQTFVLPHAYSGDGVDRCGTPNAVVFGSWQRLLLEQDRGAVLAAIDAFADAHGVPVLNCSEEAGLFRNERRFAHGSAWALAAHLRSWGPLIAAVPLEIADAPFAADAANCRSDAEMAFYAALGIGGVYSAAQPFAESDLGSGVVVANHAEAWRAGLELAWSRATDPAFANRDAVLVRRDPATLAVDRLLPALAGVFRENRLSPADLVVPAL